MSFISTKIHCENCNGVFDMAFQLPDRNVAPYPDSNNYVIGHCEKEGDKFTLSCICRKCSKRISKTYTRKEFDSMEYSILE